MTFKVGDIVEMKDPDDVEYVVTKPGTRWLVYELINDILIRVGTLSHEDKMPERMIELYGREGSRPHIDRRVRDNIKIFTVRIKDCQPVGNNAIFRGVLSQGDIWEEKKTSHWDYFNKMAKKKPNSYEMTSCFLLDED